MISEIKRRSPSKGALNADLDPAAHGPPLRRRWRGVPLGADRRRVLRRLGRRPPAPPVRRVAAGAAQGLHRSAARRVRRPADGRRLRAADRRRARAAPSWSTSTAWRRRSGSTCSSRSTTSASSRSPSPPGPTLIGVNQRDLVTFEVDHERAVRMAGAHPATASCKVAESGVRGARRRRGAARGRLRRGAGRRDAGDRRRSRPR